MRRNLITSIFFVGLCLILLCSGEKQGREDSNKLTFLFYADTRGDKDKPCQEIHSKFIDKILENEKNRGIQYLVFGGDNVLIGSIDNLWKKFFEVMNKYFDKYKNVKIYPALGNHELITSDFVLNTLKMFDKKYEQLTDEILIQKLKNICDANVSIPVIIKILEKEIKSGHIKEESKHLKDHWVRFEKYVDVWPYLKDIVDVTNKKTYYSFTLPIGNTGKSAKFIVLDSNGIDKDDQQQNWYKNELKYNNGPVITVTHHPLFLPGYGFDLFCNWDIPPHLFLVGHIHEYKRRSKNKEGNIPPLHIVSGNGGIPVEEDEGGELPSWVKSKDKKKEIYQKEVDALNYCRVTIDAEKISIIVFGCKDVDKENLEQIDSMEFSWIETNK